MCQCERTVKDTFQNSWNFLLSFQKLVPQPSRDVPVKTRKGPEDVPVKTRKGPEDVPVKTRKGPEDFRDKRSGKMHEFAQTDMDRGIGYSASEAPVSILEPLLRFTVCPAYNEQFNPQTRTAFQYDAYRPHLSGWVGGWVGGCVAGAACVAQNRITDRCKNITFPQLRWRAVKIAPKWRM